MGHRHPYKLQLAGYYLWEARQQGKAIKWAKQQFEQQLADPKSKAKGKWWELWKSLADSDRSLLRRIIYGETPTQQDKGVIRKLTRKEILTQEGNAFQVPLVQKYIEQLLEEE